MLTERNLELKFRQVPTEQLGERILRHDEDSEYAAYYLIRFRIQLQLHSIYNAMNIDEEYSDILMDFFLFLRDGKNGRNRIPFQTIDGLHSISSFEPWVINTFKNFLTDRIKEQLRRKTNEEVAMSETSQSYDYKRDNHIRSMAILLAKSRQVFAPRDQFIYYRSLLSVLGKDRTISNEQIAEAMGLSYANYRQITARTKQQATCALAKILKSQTIPLTEDEQEIVDRVNLDFENLFNIVAEFYEAALNNLACKTSIEALRTQASDVHGSSDIKYDIEEDNDADYSLPIDQKSKITSSIDDIPANLQLFKWDYALYSKICSRTVGTNLSFLGVTPLGNQFSLLLEDMMSSYEEYGQSDRK